ncbi:MAG: hypothetical protein ACI92I_000422 [Acidimicrobiales bacterium]|jgi:hypothetical protein
MIQTRDFLLFILVLLFLSVSISATLFKSDEEPQIASESSGLKVDDTEAQHIEATMPDDAFDRDLYIMQLRKKLAANDEQRIEPSPSVEASDVSSESIDDGVLQKCLYPDDALSIAPRWPLTGVEVQEKEGARLVYVSEQIVVVGTGITSASGTVEEIVETTVTPLLQLPLHPQIQNEVACVPSEVVGVTSAGILMFNGDVNSYRKVPENVLIGYARDGFPIYGVYGAEVDECGGYQHSTGYRYVVSKDVDYLVGCYKAPPVSFSL